VSARRLLLVRLPCRKVYPTGPVYLLSALRRAAPGWSFRFLDLALAPGRAWPALAAALREFAPDEVVFSWRDVQIFSPMDSDGALRDAFIVFHDPSLVRKALAGLRGLRDIASYRTALSVNLRLVGRAARALPRAGISVGGPSIRIFHDQLRRRLPARARVFAEQGLGAFFAALGLPAPADPLEPGIDLPFLESVFPGAGAYRGEVIGVQTKQGCPHRCLYCLYPWLEGSRVRHRDTAAVLDEIESYARRWGSRRFWLADAQLLGVPADHRHLSALLQGILDRGLSLEWSGYLRVHELSPGLASLMVRSGLADLEVSINSGSQRVVDELRLDFGVDEVRRGLETLKAAGYAGRVFLNLSLNAPGETPGTMRETIRVVEWAAGLFGPDRVVPVVFFLAIQPRTGLEERALAEGHIRPGYNPLSVMPWNVLRLIYNPPPLGRIVGRACVEAFRAGVKEPGMRVLQEISRATGGTDVE
jgi:hypothetical protein